jgi:hypothetical protein
MNYSKMKIHYITKENHQEAKQATRAILCIYNKAITSYGNFGNNFYTDEFDPFKYIQCRIDITTGPAFSVDLNLLHEGSAVALLCRLSPFSSQLTGKNFIPNAMVEKIIGYLQDGVFDLLPLAKDAALSAFEDEDIFTAKLLIIYEEYILGYYRKITTYQDETRPLLQISRFREKRDHQSKPQEFS